MKFKVGDRVKVKTNLKANTPYGGKIFTSFMQKFVGKKINCYICG